MATTYTSTIEVNVWKEHTCTQCGTVYRYLLQRTRQGQGATPQAAEEAAHQAAVDAVDNEVDMQPCPNCGAYQADMIAVQRSSRQWWAFLIGLPVLGLFVVLVAVDALTISTGAYILGGIAGAVLLVQLFIALSNPNSDLEGNRRLAREREGKGELWVPNKREGDAPRKPVGSGYSMGHTMGLVFLVVSAVLFLAPVGYLLAQSPPENESWRPQVVGPGDSAYIYFPESIQSLKGYWQGQVNARIENLEQLELPAGVVPALTATSKEDSWGMSISYKKNEGSQSSKLWARVTFPDDPRLVGKTLQVRMALRVRFPVIVGNSFTDQYSDHLLSAPVVMASPGAGTVYKNLWLYGSLAGLGLNILAGVMLPLVSASFRSEALPTDVFVPGGDEGDRGEPTGGESGWADDDVEGGYRRDEEDEDYRRRR